MYLLSQTSSFERVVHMFRLQTTLFLEGWRTVAESEDLVEIERKRDNIKVLPLTITRIVKQCNICKEEVEMGQLSEFSDATICPNCSNPW
ncbi:MAG: hypothetical protein A3D35_00475 [Candidatus Staskawiczbacteria bacterium RIFCSPHIGHO2_02_FULL_34_9]|uniref:Uncharacterized protein n=1 Tax=Candidatus Staskawiczbacteria bacterium RIFCSPHIGHO2_02_FULL_34_9 TaxID=1802206 RepID=A0A1G2HYG2_9BACT|nr:MAG: hypothetical protein A3D35_00475 [Candidatus Staskawiczbacteria bacterium RIFCSPHIGHO2_02_FULL_34_9]